MARDVLNNIDKVRSPEDASSHKVSVKYVFNPETGEFYPESSDLYSGTPVLHRENVTQVDTGSPDITAGLDCLGWKRCRFDVSVVGENITLLKVGVLRWNTTTSGWFYPSTTLDLTDSECFTISGGDICLIEDEAFGATIFLKVFDFQGSNFCLNCWAILC